MSFVLVRLRALEFAALLHDGWRHQHLTTLAVIDNARWSMLALSLTFCSAAMIALTTTSTENLSYNLLVLGVTSLSALIGAALGSVIGAATVREKHLFTLFKNR